MKITFLGTSHGAPAADRYCSCTVLESGGAVYLIDAGAPVTDCLLRAGKPLTALRAVFVTHAHSDHTMGLFPLVSYLNWYEKNASADFYLPEQALTDCIENVIAVTDGMAVNSERLRLRLIDPSVSYGDENIKVEFLPTRHMPNGAPSYALLVTEGEKRVLFTGDLSGDLRARDLPPVASKAPLDLVVCELAHFDLEQLSPCLQNSPIKHLYFHHVYPLEKYAVIEAAKADFPFVIGTPKDGDVLTL